MSDYVSSTGICYKSGNITESKEVLNGSPRDLPSDIWSWGCLALEIITDNPPYHEILTDTQVVLSICRPEDHRKTPEPSDISSLLSTALALLRMCWSFEPGQRPDVRRCVDEVEAVLWFKIQFPKLLNFTLPVHLFTPSTRLTLSVEPEDWNDLVCRVSIARLSLRDTNKAVMFKCLDISFRPFLGTIADHLNRRWALKHENLLELIGYSMDLGLKTFYVISPYMDQTVLLQYLRRNRHLAPRARLKLLQDMLKGLLYLHSSANVVHGALNPWTIVVNGEGKAVLPLIGSFFGSVPVTQVRVGLPERPTHLWVAPPPEVSSKSDIWSWACIVLQVICESRQFDGTSIHSPEFLKPGMRRTSPLGVTKLILPDRLLELVRKCWNRDSEERPSASDCLGVLDLVIQEISECVGTMPGSGGSVETFPDVVEEAS